MFVSTSSRQSNKSGQSSSLPSPPQSNMVLRKGIRKIKQGMKKYVFVSFDTILLKAKITECFSLLFLNIQI